jgi:formate hydrogenlyase subunit 6/NADH:ubiquinone oxidoreductase subunit I
LEDNKPGLAFKYADCTDCHLCREICYTASIELVARVDLRKVIAQTIEVVWSNTPTSSHEEKLKRLRMFR